MKTLSLITLLLFSQPASALTYIRLTWQYPSERTDNTVIVKGELDYTTVYNANCETGERSEVLFPRVKYPTAIVLIKSKEPLRCFILTVTDIDGRTSDGTEMVATDFSKPNPVTCK